MKYIIAALNSIFKILYLYRMLIYYINIIYYIIYYILYILDKTKQNGIIM